MDLTALLFRTPWLVAGVVVLATFRVLSLLALRPWGMELNLGHLVSFVWDVLLAAGLFGLGRVFELASVGRKALRIALRALLVALVLGAALARCADVAYCFLTGGHWSSAGFLYASPDNVGLLRDGNGPVLVGCMIGGVVLLLAALFMDARALASRVPSGTKSRRVLQAFSLVALVVPLLVGFNDIEEATARFVPESLFVHEWLAWRGILGSESSSITLKPDVMSRFVKLGLAPEKPLFAGYPLSRATLDPTPFPYPQTPNAALGRPNLVFTLVEQLNHEFIYSFSGELRGVMPELTNLSRRMTMVTDYQSTANPTIHALIASLCSLHAASHYRDINLGQGGDVLTHTPFVCLPKVLKDLGYRTVFIQGGKKEFASKADILSAHGFEEIHGRPELEARFPGQDISRWGMHDDVLVNYAQQQIKRLEKLREKDGRPFFVMMLTLDTHSPGLAPPECAMPGSLLRITADGDSRDMIRSLHCTDASLGRLGRFILDDRTRSKRTVWAVTGDHPTSAMKFVRDIHQRYGESYTGWSGRMPLLIYDPTHQLPARVPVLSSHIDLAPTLLHILGIRDAPNSMTGFSIFGRRPQLPMLIGRVGPKYVALYLPNHQTRSMTMGMLGQLCASKQPIFEKEPKAMSACDLQRWVRWQNVLWSDKRLFPAGK